VTTHYGTAARAIVALFAAVAVWLVAGNARASAPLCDSRGAITFAPNPTLEEPNTSMDVGQPDDCSGLKTANELAYDHGHGPTGIDSANELARTTLSAWLLLIDPTATGVVAVVGHPELTPRLDRDRLDRPPR
jgi:hypothetical protein